MALFKLTDITFNKESRNPQGPLSKLESYGFLGLDTNVLKYPSDLGDYGKGHYMIFYINEQVNTQYSDASDYSGSPTIQRYREAIQAQKGPINAGQSVGNLIGGVIEGGSAVFEAATKTSVAKETSDAITAFSNSNLGQSVKNTLSNLSNPFGSAAAQQTNNFILGLGTAISSGAGQIKDQLNSGSFLRKVKRTKQAIALYMPDTLTFAYNQSYNDLAVFDTLGLVGSALSAGSSIADAIKNGASQESAVNIASFGLDTLKQLGIAGGAANIGLAQLGVASNPGLEVIYGSPSFRSFRFDFIFYPRSRKEAADVQNIINSLTFHQAPEYASQTGGKFLVPPSEFDIEFYYDGKINPNIPKISTCVLTSIDLDYAPNGFTAYEVPSQDASVGGTGMPVAIRMSLNFKETLIVTKEYLRWVETGAPDAPRQRTQSEIDFSNSLGNFEG